jgi:hypothetical protein
MKYLYKYLKLAIKIIWNLKWANEKVWRIKYLNKLTMLTTKNKINKSKFLEKYK